jgi:hypothetical protein
MHRDVNTGPAYPWAGPVSWEYLLIMLSFCPN